MATRDFRSSQIRTTQIIASGSDTTSKPSLLIYSASAATNDQGATTAQLLTNVGEDAWLFVSGSKNGVHGHKAQVLFGGSVALSGTLSGSAFVAMPGESFTLSSDDNINFVIDKDGNSTSAFSFKSGATEVANLNESGTLQLDGTLDVDGGSISVTAANDAAASILLQADNSDDAGDDWQITANADQTFTVGNDIASAGTPVTHVSITPNATVTNSTVNVVGNLDVGNTLTVPGDIVHTGDTDTKISFDTDDIKITAGGIDTIKTNATSVIINEDNVNVDFEVRGDGANVRAIHVDASADTIKFLDDDSDAIAEKDVNFLVHSPNVGLKNSNTRGVALFKGDVVVSGTLYADKQVLEVDLVQSGSNLILSSSLHFQNSGPEAGESFAVPPNDGAIFVSTGSLIAKLADAAGNTTEIKIGQNYIAGDGLTSTIANPNTTFHASIAAISGSAMGATDIATGDLFAVADVSEPDDRTRKITATDLVTNLSQNGIRQATGADAPGFQTDDGIVAHLSGSVFSGLVGITGSNNISLTTINRVGVGVSDPDAKLEVLDTGTQLKLSYDADTFATLAVTPDGDLTLTTKESDSDIVFQVDDAGSEFTALKIDGANAGSAAFTPASGGGLSVTPTGDNAIAEVDGGEIKLTKASNTGTVAPTITFKKSRGVIGGKTNLTDGATIGNILFDGFDTGSATSAAITAKADGDHGDSTTDVPGQIIFSTTGNGTETLTSRMVIRQDGKVGVGVDDPDESLDISGNIKLRGNIIKASDGGSTITLDTDDNVSVAGNLTVVGGDITLANGSTIDSSANAGVLLLTEDVVATSAALRVGGNTIQASDGGSTITMDASDNVTIGGDLTVSGGDIAGPADGDFIVKSDGNITFRIDADNDETGQSFSFQNTTTEIANLDEAGNLQTAGNIRIDGNVIQNSQGETTLTMDTDQKVGIGPNPGGSFPSYMLDVNGDIRVRGNDIRDSGSNVAISFDGSTNTEIKGTLRLTGENILGADGSPAIGINNANTVISGTLSVASEIQHVDDPNTKIAFDNDQIDIIVGAASASPSITVKENDTQDEVVINDGSADIDFRVESNDNQHAILVDAAKNQVLINSGDSADDVSFFVSGSDGVTNSALNHGGISVFSGDVVISGSLFDGSHSRINLISVSENGTFSSGQTASGTNAVAIGQNATATGTSAIAIGQNSVAGGSTGHSIVAGGLGNTASGDYSAVLGGQSNTASGDYAAAIGRSNTVSGEDSVAIGKSLTVNTDNTIAIGNNTNNADVQVKGTLNVIGNVTLDDAASLLVPESIVHKGDTNTLIKFDTDQIKLDTNGATKAHVTSTQVLIMSQSGHSDDFNAQNAADVNFYVMGRKNSKDTTTAGTSVFGGDVHISGSLSGPSQYALTDNSVRMFRDGSTMKFVDGVTTTKTLEQLSSVAASTSHFIGAHGVGAQVSKIHTSASIAFAGDLNNSISNLAASGVGSDVYFFVSGTLGTKNGATRHVSLFGGDFVVSGSSHLAGVTGTDIEATGDLVAGGNVIKNSNGDSAIRFNSADAGVFIGSQFDTAAQSLLDIRKDDNTTLTSGGDGNTLANFNLALRNHSTTENAFAGIAFDVANEQDIDRIGASIAGVRRTTDADNHKTDLVFSTNIGDDSGGVDDGLTERLRITSAGQIGVNTTPATAFHISATDSLVIPVGTTAQRGTNTQGGIRFNTNLSAFEGYSGAAWSSLGGVKDVDGDTFIEAESSPGADNDDLRFVTGGTERMTITGSTGIVGITGRLEVSSHVTASNFVAKHGNFYAADGQSLGLYSPHHVVVHLDTDNNGNAEFQIDNGAGTEVFVVNESGDLQIDGDLTISGNDIKDSASNTIFTFDGSGNVSAVAPLTVATLDIQDLKVGGDDIKDSGNNTVLSFDGSGNIDNNASFSGIVEFTRSGAGSNPASLKVAKGVGSTSNNTTLIALDGNSGRNIELLPNGTSFFKCINPSSGQMAIVSNEAGQDVDFRIEAITTAGGGVPAHGNVDADYSFFLKGDTGQTGLGVGDMNSGFPDARLAIKGVTTNVDPYSSKTWAKVTGSLDDGRLDLYANNSVTARINANGMSMLGGDGTEEPSLLIVRRDTSTTQNDLLGGIGFDSSDGNVPTTILNASAFIAGYASEAHGANDKGGYLVFGTTAINDNDDTASQEQLRIEGTQITAQVPVDVMMEGDPALSMTRIDSDIDNDEVIGQLQFNAAASAGDVATVLGEVAVLAAQDNMALGSDCPTTMEFKVVRDGTNTLVTAATLDGGGTLTATDLSATGNISSANFQSLADGDLTVRSDGNITFIIDGDNDETSQSFSFKNNFSTEIANLDESGNLQIGGDLTVTGNDIKSSTGTTAITLSGNDVSIADTLTTAGDVTVGGGNLFVERTTSAPDLRLKLEKTTIADGDDVGVIRAYGSEDGSNYHQMGYILIEADEDFNYAGDAAGARLKFGLNTNGASTPTNKMELDNAGNLQIDGDLTVSGGDIFGPTDGDLRIRSDADVKIYLDDDNGGTNTFDILNGAGTTITSINESGHIDCNAVHVGSSLQTSRSTFEGTTSSTTSDSIVLIKHAATNDGNTQVAVDVRLGQEDSTDNYDTGEIFIQFTDGSGTILGDIDNQVTYNNFTGAHITYHESMNVDDDSWQNIWRPGMILRSNGQVLSDQQAMSTALVGVEIADTKADKRVIGVFKTTQINEGNRQDIPDSVNRFIRYNAVGEGKMLVTDSNGNIENGDYICSSNVLGCGEKQSDDILHSYTVAKATTGVDWSTVEPESDGIKRKLISCTYHCG